MRGFRDELSRDPWLLARSKPALYGGNRTLCTFVDGLQMSGSKWSWRKKPEIWMRPRVSGRLSGALRAGFGLSRGVGTAYAAATNASHRSPGGAGRGHGCRDPG